MKYEYETIQTIQNQCIASVYFCYYYYFYYYCLYYYYHFLSYYEDEVPSLNNSVA